MRFECYGASRPQAGRSFNEDAFLIEYAPIPFAVLCDGTGNAEQVARHIITQFTKLFKETSLARILSNATWCKWVKLLDSSLPRGMQSTFVAAAVVGNQLVGTYVGDSRAYLFNNGTSTILTGEESVHPLGTGKAVSTPIRINLKSKSIVLIMSDGAWIPLDPNLIQSIAASAAVNHLSELPEAILNESEHRGRLDDMTAIALRIL